MFSNQPDILPVSEPMRRAVGYGLAGALGFALAVLITPLPSHAANVAVAQANTNSNNPASGLPEQQEKAKSPETMPPPEWPMGPGNELTKDEKLIDQSAYPKFKASLVELNHYASESFNGPMFASSEKIARGVVRVTPTAAWMGSGRTQEKSAMTLYRFWRNANRFLPVRLIITDDKGNDYIVIEDTPHGLNYLVRDRDSNMQP